jgi:hypothetical protein
MPSVRLTVGDLKRESERAERLGQLLLDMLRAPYEGNQAWAISAACQTLRHPRVRQHGQGACACGARP